jgi:2-succinyl-5-enolpyruvyl-6-hydroxy-3-cyclohexene-1-carboxylate synthase
VNDSAYRAAAVFVASLSRLGLRHACLTPGSRSTPLALAFAEHPGITDWVHHDERSSAFFALGLAKATRAPVAVVTTSGTAAAELLPAAVEARYGGTALLLLTADRPPELRGIGAPQTIHQDGIFGVFAATAADVLIADMDVQAIEALAVAVWDEMSGRPRRPVHVNLGFREPFVPADLTIPESSATPAVVHGPDVVGVETVASLLSGRRTLIAAGPLDLPGFEEAVTALAARANWPILADPLSQLRAGIHDRSHVVTSGNALLVTGRIPQTPEAVIRFGAPLTSNALSRWLTEHAEVPQVIVDEHAGRDPTGTARVLIEGDPARFVRALAVDPGPSEWSDAWIAADTRARAALGGSPFPSEPAVVEVLSQTLEAGSILYVASSMPVRDVDDFFPAVDRPIRILGNRGANGIDGLVSSGLGAAATGTRTVILAGDLSVLHDLGALATAARLHLPVTIVVLNNDGGGIFSFLPQAALDRHFERVFSTPHGISFVPVATALGLRAVTVDRTDDFRSEITEPGLIEVVTDRTSNVAIHEAALERVRAMA